MLIIGRSMDPTHLPFCPDEPDTAARSVSLSATMPAARMGIDER